MTGTPAWAQRCDGVVYGFKRQFQLAEDEACGTNERGMAIDGGAVHFAVGSGDDDDGVFAAVGNENRRYAGGAGDALDGCSLTPAATRLSMSSLAENIFADHANHLDRIAEASCGDGLVGAFAAGSCIEAGADDGLAGTGIWRARVTRSMLMLPTTTIGLRRSLMMKP